MLERKNIVRPIAQSKMRYEAYAIVVIICKTWYDYVGGEKSSKYEENDGRFWHSTAQKTLIDRLKMSINTNVAKNVIFFLGDGMSFSTLMATRAYMSPEWDEANKLSFEKFQYTGLSKTYCVDTQVPDSACSATAYLGGVKTNLGTIGVTGAVSRRDCAAMKNSANHVNSIGQWAQNAGKMTGLVTTTRITHASPAGLYAHTAERKWEDDSKVLASGYDPEECADIAQQLIFGRPGKNFNVIFGGGRRSFYPKEQYDFEGTPGLRLDGRNLIDRWKEDKINKSASYAYVTTRQELLQVDPSPEYLLGLFSSSHMSFRLEAPLDEPTLSEMTVNAIRHLQRSPIGFFLFIESGKIDLAHHENTAKKALEETAELSRAVAAAVNMTEEEDTLILVTADHSHVMTVSGYPVRGNDILGLAGMGDDELPYSTISYANGPGYTPPDESGKRRNLSKEDMGHNSYKFPSMVPLADDTHGGEDVAVFANGPWSHLFSGSFEQNYIPHAIGFAACIGNGITTCRHPG